MMKLIRYASGLAASLINWIKKMFGLQVFDKTGKKTLDVTSRACLVLGTIEIGPAGGANAVGSIYVAELDGGNGTPFAFISNFSGNYWGGAGGLGFPYCGITNGAIVWNNTTGYSITLTYGIF